MSRKTRIARKCCAANTSNIRIIPNSAGCGATIAHAPNVTAVRTSPTVSETERNCPPVGNDSTPVKSSSTFNRPGTAGSLINFVHPKDAGGVLIELVQAPPATVSA